MAKKIDRILVANRGEIAMRIIASCRSLGIETVTVYAHDDRFYPHALESDYSVELEGEELRDTYLNQEKLIAVAKEMKCHAIHPGYGLLSENADFCEKVESAKLIFIGPTAEHIKLMGSKSASKKSMSEIGVPLIPGYFGDDQELDTLVEEADKIGYPLLIKASAGGGGKGMRVVEDPLEFSQALDSAKSEAMRAFGDDHILLEKYITKPRHIEVQVLSDVHGQHFHLYERECSIQRRHQKIIEETPSPALTNSQRKEICEAAVKITRGIGYRGAGTVEFILDEDGSFYFLEMNTRLQVEHPITEQVTGVDLVAQQIYVAKGLKLKLSQEQIQQRGHSIEARIYAENPDNMFLPTTGKLIHMGESYFSDTRIETGLKNGNEVTIQYDPMCAKIVTYAENREQATQKMIIELSKLPFFGLITNREYLKRILRHEKFKSGETFTSFVEDYADELKDPEATDFDIATAIASLYFADQNTESISLNINETKGAWDQIGQYRNV